VKAAVAWFESAKITGIRVEKVDGDRQVIADPSAPPLWARFYDLETGRPFFCDRDGVKKPQLSEIGRERRNGYAWYGNWGESVATEYAKWPHR
jgi:PelA/Pel-15E family pectate lyase